MNANFEGNANEAPTTSKKRINKQHSKFAEYVSKCEALAHAYAEKVDAAESQYPNWRGLDHPAAHEVLTIAKEFNKKLRALQTEYDFLFREEP